LPWVREDLLRAGDIYSPARGHVVMSVPAFAPFLLANYEQARDAADTDLMPLADMQRGLGNSVGGPRIPPPLPGN
jgi:hypothetical protein